MLINNNEFTRFGDSLRRGDFKNLPKESFEYKQIWEEQLNRCMNGYSIGGKWMSGKLYGYVNFGTIRILDEHGKGKKIGKPSLRDVDWLIDYHKVKARAEGKGLILVSGRRLGKSYSASWDLVDDCLIHRDSCAVGVGDDAANSSDIIQMFKLHLAGLKEMGAELYTPVIRSKMGEYIEFGYKYQDNKTKGWVDKTTGGILYDIVFKHNLQAANGKSTRTFIFEEIGKFKGLIDAYNAAQPCWKEGSKSFGLPVLQGTGGDMEESSVEACEMFYDPDTYNLTVVDTEEGRRKQGLFIPGWMSFNDCRNENGIIDKVVAKRKVDEERAILKKGRKLESLFKHMQFWPNNPEEAFLKSTGNIFPAELIQERLQGLLSKPSEYNAGVIGKLIETGGKVEFRHDSSLREVDFPVKKTNDNTGAVVIYEVPNSDLPVGTYIIGLDPYSQDDAPTSPSVGCAIVYKLLSTIHETFEIPVAEYTGRPLTTDDFFENVRKLALYYKAQILYESDTPGTKAYFDKKNALYLLAPQPTILKDIIIESLVDRNYGVPMSTKVKRHIINIIRNWLLTPYTEGRYNIDKIYSINLLKELKDYSNEGNFDRVIAFGLCLLYAENNEKYRQTTSGEVIDKDSYFNEYFTRNGW